MSRQTVAQQVARRRRATRHGAGSVTLGGAALLAALVVFASLLAPTLANFVAAPIGAPIGSGREGIEASGDGEAPRREGRPPAPPHLRARRPSLPHTPPPLPPSPPPTQVSRAEARAAAPDPSILPDGAAAADSDGARAAADSDGAREAEARALRARLAALEGISSSSALHPPTPTLGEAAKARVGHDEFVHVRIETVEPGEIGIAHQHLLHRQIAP